MLLTQTQASISQLSWFSSPTDLISFLRRIFHLLCPASTGSVQLLLKEDLSSLLTNFFISLPCSLLLLKSQFPSPFPPLHIPISFVFPLLSKPSSNNYVNKRATPPTHLRPELTSLVTMQVHSWALGWPTLASNPSRTGWSCWRD